MISRAVACAALSNLTLWITAARLCPEVIMQLTALIAVLAALLVGLSACSFVSPMPPPAATVQTITTGAADAERLGQSDEHDSRDVTPLALLADALNPWPSLASVIAIPIALWWSLGEVVMGHPLDLDRRYKQVRAYLPGYAGPDPTSAEGQAAYRRFREASR